MQLGDFTYRFVNNNEKDILEAANAYVDSYLSPFFNKQERIELCQITNPFVRKKEILLRLSKLTNGKITNLEQGGGITSMLNLPDRDEKFPYMLKRVRSLAEKGLLHSCWHNDKIAGLNGCAPFNPKEFITDEKGKLERDQSSNPMAVMDYDAHMKFAHFYLNDSYFTEIRKIINLNQILVGGPLAIRYEYRGYRLPHVMHYFHLKYLYKLGYRLFVVFCGGPISAAFSVSEGMIPLPQISLSYPDFIWKGTKPFEAISFRSNVPGCDDLFLCCYELIEKKIEMYEKEKNFMEKFKRYIKKSAL